MWGEGNRLSPPRGCAPLPPAGGHSPAPRREASPGCGCIQGVREDQGAAPDQGPSTQLQARWKFTADEGASARLAAGSLRRPLTGFRSVRRGRQARPRWGGPRRSQEPARAGLSRTVAQRRIYAHFAATGSKRQGQPCGWSVLIAHGDIRSQFCGGQLVPVASGIAAAQRLGAEREVVGAVERLLVPGIIPTSPRLHAGQVATTAGAPRFVCICHVSLQAPRQRHAIAPPRTGLAWLEWHRLDLSGHGRTVAHGSAGTTRVDRHSVP